MGRHNVTDIVRPMRQQTLDGTATGIGIVDPKSVNDGSPSLIEGRGVVCRVGAGGQAKRDKDLRQAGMLFDALPMTGHGPSLADVLEEAWDRGTAWKLAISEAAEIMHKEYWHAVNRIVGILDR